jgi:hypothetical protein
MDFSLELGREVLRQTPLVLQGMLSALSEDWIAGDEGPETWSPYRVVGHLTHIDECDWIDRTRAILEHGDERVLQPAIFWTGSPRCGPRLRGGVHSLRGLDGNRRRPGLLRSRPSVTSLPRVGS